jgi:hypothetical protein
MHHLRPTCATRTMEIHQLNSLGPSHVRPTKRLRAPFKVLSFVISNWTSTYGWTSQISMWPRVQTHWTVSSTRKWTKPTANPLVAESNYSITADRALTPVSATLRDASAVFAKVLIWERTVTTMQIVTQVSFVIVPTSGLTSHSVISWKHPMNHAKKTRNAVLLTTAGTHQGRIAGQTLLLEGAFLFTLKKTVLLSVGTLRISTLEQFHTRTLSMRTTSRMAFTARVALPSLQSLVSLRQ